MSVFDGIKNLFNKDEEEQILNNSSWFSPRHSINYNDNKEAYDMANYYWTTGKFPVIERDKNTKTGYEQDSSSPLDLNYSYSALSPLYYTSFRDKAVAQEKQQLEEEAKQKRGALDRIFGLISNNSLVQGAYYALDNDDDTTFMQGVKEGFSYMNPFNDDVSNRKSFSDVLELIEKDDDPTDDKLGENIVEGLLGFAGDVFLDPLTYVTGGFSAIGKIAKGSGAAVKGLKYVDSAGNIIDSVDKISDLSKAVKSADTLEDVSHASSEFIKKTARDSYESYKKVNNVSQKIADNLSKNVNPNSGYVKVLDFDTAKNVIKKYDFAERYTGEEIDNMASNLVESFNKTFFGLKEGGQDLTVFGKKIADSNYIRKIGDNTVAPYYNKLANKIRQTKIAKNFGANPYSKSAFNDFEDAFMPYFNKFMSNANKAHIAKTAKETTDFSEDVLENLTKEENDRMLDLMESGQWKAAEEYYNNKINLDKKAIEHAKKTNAEYQKYVDDMTNIKGVLNAMNVTKTKIKNGVETVDTSLLDLVDRIRLGSEASVDELLSARSSDIEDIFGKSISEMDVDELAKAKELVVSELDPTFGIYGTHSVISSTEKPINEILYDYLVDDSVFNISKSQDATDVMERLFGDANVESAKKALSKEMLRKLKTANSDDFIESGIKAVLNKTDNLSSEAISVFNELKNRYNAFDVFTRSANNKYMLSTYGSDLTKIRDALISEKKQYDELSSFLENESLKSSPRAYENAFNQQIYDIAKFYDPLNITKIIKENTSDPILSEDLSNLITGLNDIYNNGDISGKAVNEILSSLKAKINAGVAKNSLNGKSADIILKHNIIRNLSIDDRITLAKNIRETNQTKFYKYIDSLSEEEKYAKYFSPNSTATEKTKNIVLRHEVDKAFETDSVTGEITLNASKLSDVTSNYLQGCIEDASAKLQTQFDSYSQGLSDIESKFESSIDILVDKYLKSVMGFDDEQISTIKSLDPDSEMFKVMQEFQDRMSDIASKERSIGVLRDSQVDAYGGKYVKHMFTKEAQDAFLKNPELENRLGYYAEGVSTVKKSSQHRKFKTIKEAESALQELYPNSGVTQWFETDLAKLYCARCIDSDRLIGQKENISYILKNLATPYEGAGSLTASKELVVNYEDLTQALMKAQGVKKKHIMDKPQNIDFSVLEDFGVNPDYVTSNNPLVRISEDGFKALNQYLDNLSGAYSNTVKGYSIESSVIDVINQNSLKQNNLTENAFFKLFDKFTSVYKMANTIYSPSFYGNNAIGNAFNSFLYCGAAAFDPRKIKIARGIASTGDPKQFLTLHGETYSYKQLRDICGRLGISNTSFYEHEIKEDAKGFANLKLNKKLLEISSGIEDTQRIALFIEALDNTGDFSKAVDVVNKFLFDYSDLSEFEHKVMKRAIPFYTFMRKNNPLQLEQIFVNPQIYRNLNYGFNNFEVMSGSNYVEDTNRNEWRKDYVQLPFQINGENIGFNLNLPYETLERLTPSKILGQSNPLIKALPELYSGKYAYTGMDVNSVPEYLMNQIAPVRIMDGISNKEGLSKSLYGLSQATGINVATIKDQLGSQQQLVEKYYPYVNAENVGYENEDIFEALLKKIKGDDGA